MNWSNGKYYGVITDGVLKLSHESQALLARENIERMRRQNDEV